MRRILLLISCVAVLGACTQQTCPTYASSKKANTSKCAYEKNARTAGFKY